MPSEFLQNGEFPTDQNLNEHLGMLATNQRVLTITAPLQVSFAERSLPSPGPEDVVVRSLYSTFKHGTEILAYRGKSPFATKAFNEKLR